MHISSIRVKNFRLLRDYSIDLERGLSLIVGKNNTGKTSLLKILSRFLCFGDGSKFQFNDFSILFRETLKNLIEGEEIIEEDYIPEGITMRIVIKYEEGDDLEYISPILMTLDVDNFYAVLGFDYMLAHTDYIQMRADYLEFRTREAAKKAEQAEYEEKDWLSFIEPLYSRYFKIVKKTISVDKNGVIDESKFIKLSDIADFKLDNLISFKFIEARRSVDNAESDKTLSNQTSQLYDIMEGDGRKQNIIESMIDKLKDMDVRLSDFYSSLFNEISEKIKLFGGMTPNDTKISVISTLSHKNLINGNTTVKYTQGGKELPESYNGLGYMNLLSMIFQIEYIRQQFTRINERKPSDINLLFIEEPEAHTHPQMQYVFIQNIKKLLAEGVINKLGEVRPLQYLISTHSSHIVADCDFDDIKYMLIEEDGYSAVKNISTLYDAYEDDKLGFAFLKQYLTINRSELFFADKAVLIEGDTERILLPAMMQKIDDEFPVEVDNKEKNLLSQNISIIEAGAYSHIFTPFINFIGLKKVCVITDIDMCKPEKIKDKNGHERIVTSACRWSDDKSLVTSNTSLKTYLLKTYIHELDALTDDDKLITWDNDSKQWKSTPDGNVRVCYQVEEMDYHARSFEDSFFKINEHFIKDENHCFRGLQDKALLYYREGREGYDNYELANKGITSKANLAIDILYMSNSEADKPYQGWSIPKYIKDGLLWLRKD